MSDQESKFYDMIFRRNDREENERVNRINRLDFPFIAREGAMDDARCSTLAPPPFFEALAFDLGTIRKLMT